MSGRGSRWLLLLMAGLVLAPGLHADPLVGSKWAPFALQDRKGQLKKWEPGMVTVFSFCAMWCSTWKTQVPRLALAKTELEGLPVRFVTISIDGRWSQVDRENGGLPLWLDRGGEWAHRQGVDRVPTTVVVDGDGVVRTVQGGVSRTSDIVAAVQKALKPEKTSKVIYLSFDDFPAEHGNQRLLDILFARRVRATFFCVGAHMKDHVDVLKSALENGDRLECHSWSHVAAEPHLDWCWKAFYDLLGIEPTLYRPPGSEHVLGLQRQLMDDDPYDFERPAANELLRRVLSAAGDGKVIQLHAGVNVTMDVLPKIIENLRGRGYRFELLGGPNPTTPSSPPDSFTERVPDPRTVGE